METKRKVSVIIPVYNHEKFVGRAIQSVLNQTFQDFEIIVTDDGSSDNSYLEIKKIIDPRIKVFRFEKNSGISAAMNHCIRNSSGIYIAHLNADDAFMPEKLEKQVSFMKNNKDVGAVFTDVRLIDDQGRDFNDRSSYYFEIFNQPNRNRFEWLNHFFYKGNCLCHPSAFIRRECFEEIGYYDCRFHQMQDFETWVRICLKYEIYVIQEKLTKFGVVSGEGNVSANTSSGRIRSAWEGTKVLEHFLNLNASEMEKVFPDVKQFKYPLDNDLVPYYLARLAISAKSFIHDHFAMETLYDFYGNDIRTNKLNAHYGLNSQEFVRLAGELDIFRVIEIENAKNKNAYCNIYKSKNHIRRLINFLKIR